MTNGSKKSGSTSTARSRARDQIKDMNERTKEILEAIRRNVSGNIDVLDNLTNSLLAEDSDHTPSDCATDLCAASVACWGHAMDLFHEVVKTCLSEKGPSKEPSQP